MLYLYTFYFITNKKLLFYIFSFCKRVMFYLSYYIMYYIVIIIIIIIILIIYQIYVTCEIFNNKLDMYSLVDLNKPPIDIISPLKNSSNSKYSFSIWIYINSWNTYNYKPLITKTSYGYNNNTLTYISNDFDFSLCLDKILPNLIYKLNSSSNTSINPIIIPGIPIKKWTQIIISVDLQIIDVYIDGKLILSHKLETLPQNINDSIIFGNGFPMDIKINHFQWWYKSIDPQTAWKSYLYSKNSL